MGYCILNGVKNNKEIKPYLQNTSTLELMPSNLKEQKNDSNRSGTQKKNLSKKYQMSKLENRTSKFVRVI